MIERHAAITAYIGICTCVSCTSRSRSTWCISSPISAIDTGRSLTIVVSGGICIAMTASPAGPYVSATLRGLNPA